MFGSELIDAGLLPAMFVALLAGMISFLSPCVLPIVPPYLAYMGGISLHDVTEDKQSVAETRRKAMLPALFFVMGLSTVFLFLGFTASAFGTFFLRNQELFAQIAGCIVIVFGWPPCIGPQLGAILSLAASEASITRGTTLLAVYAAGLGIPFLLAAFYLHRAVGVMGRLKRHMALIEKVMGALLLLVGIAMLSGAFTWFSWWLLEQFPALAVLG